LPLGSGKALPRKKEGMVNLLIYHAHTPYLLSNKPYRTNEIFRPFSNIKFLKSDEEFVALRA
jgi:hypothetical protein